MSLCGCGCGWVIHLAAAHWIAGDCAEVGSPAHTGWHRRIYVYMCVCVNEVCAIWWAVLLVFLLLNRPHHKCMDENPLGVPVGTQHHERPIKIYWPHRWPYKCGCVCARARDCEKGTERPTDQPPVSHANALDAMRSPLYLVDFTLIRTLAPMACQTTREAHKKHSPSAI